MSSAEKIPTHKAGENLREEDVLSALNTEPADEGREKHRYRAQRTLLACGTVAAFRSAL